MKITRTDDTSFSMNFADHRGGAVPRQMLAAGHDNSRDNFAYAYVRGNGERYSPRHRHNFDQIRFPLKGDMSMGKREKLKEGHIGYFPESTYYGPQISSEGEDERRAMVIQFTGASGAVYLSTEQQREGQRALLDFGRFENGVFVRERGDGKKKQDGFEAIWEYLTGEKIRYAAPRYNTPVFIDPESFVFRPTGTPGVRRKMLGVFSERETRIEVMELDAGAVWDMDAGDTNQLLFVFEGGGSCAGEDCPNYTGIWLEPHETASFEAAGTTQILAVSIPTWESFIGSMGSADAA